MTRTQLAKMLNVTTHTLKNWEKEKPELVRLINLGLHTDNTIQETKKLLEKLEEIEAKANSGKFELK